MMQEVDLASPWMIHARKVKAMFEMDDEVRVEYDDEPRVRLYVSNPSKANAIESIIKHEVPFGNVILKVDVIPPNEGMTTEQNFRAAFESNPVFAGTITEDIPGGQAVFAVFEPVTVQYKNDDISSAFGVETTTYEQLAKDVFGEDDGAFICSDLLPDVVG
jgi:hypothetical protein